MPYECICPRCCIRNIIQSYLDLSDVFNVILRLIFRFARLSLNDVDKAPSGLKRKQYSLLILVDFDAKMVNIADLEYSADANLGMRQVKCFIPAHSSPSDDHKKGCSSDQPPWDPQGGPKVPPRGYTEKKFVFERGVQTIQNALICLDLLL